MIALPPPPVPHWDIQLSAPITAPSAAIVELDGDEATPAQVAAIKAQGGVALCYVSTGTWESYRADAAAFPAAVLGRRWPDWPDERFLDIRARDVLVPILRDRFRVCAGKGFDGIDGDNQDIPWAESGFPVTPADQVAYSRALAEAAHALGLRFGQKNAPDLIPDLAPHLDFLVTESCAADGWCDRAQPYLTAGKPVLDIEYTDTAVDFDAACRSHAGTGVTLVLKTRDLNGGFARHCPASPSPTAREP